MVLTRPPERSSLADPDAQALRTRGWSEDERTFEHAVRSAEQVGGIAVDLAAGAGEWRNGCIFAFAVRGVGDRRPTDIGAAGVHETAPERAPRP